MYQDVEYKLAQYAQWCGNPLRALDYPGRAIYARAIPDAIDPEALPEMPDAEAKVVGDALLALKRDIPEAHQVIEARFLHRCYNDCEVGRKLRLGGKDRIWRLRLQGFGYLRCYFRLIPDHD